MKRFSVLITLLASGFALGQVKMAVFVQGHLAGSASLSQRLTESGGRFVELGMTVRSGEDTITVRSQTTLDAKGAPVRMFQQTITAGKTRSSREVIVSFDGDGANVVEDKDGLRTTKHVKAAATPSREDSSEFWFVTDHPAVGACATAQKFELDSLEWKAVTTTFRGVRPMTVNGQRVVANVTDSPQGTSFLDSEGLPLRLEMANATLERVWEKL